MALFSRQTRSGGASSQQTIDNCIEFARFCLHEIADGRRPLGRGMRDEVTGTAQGAPSRKALRRAKGRGGSDSWRVTSGKKQP